MLSQNKLQNLSEQELLKLYKENKQKITETLDKIEKLKKKLKSETEG